MTWVARILFIGMSVAALWLLFGCQSAQYPYQTTILTERGVEIPFHLAVARTDEEKEKGLSERSYIPKDSGMVFVSDVTMAIEISTVSGDNSLFAVALEFI